MRRLVGVLAVAALAGSVAALAGRGDPQERFTRADQARAKSMLLRQKDMPAGFRSLPASGPDSDFYCKALDESDLTLTGEAEGILTRGSVGIFTVAQVYVSLADTNASWRRGTSKAGEKCLGAALRRELLVSGVRDVVVRRFPFPRVAERSVAYRVVGLAQGVPAFFDFVVMQRSRAQVALFMTSALQPVLKPEQVRLARIVAGRMATAMRDS